MLKAKEAYQLILQLLPSLLEMKPGDSQKSISKHYMDLNVDCLRVQPNQIKIALSHYYKQNGDIVADPDMEIVIFPLEKEAQPISYQDSYTYKRIDETTPLSKKSELLKFLITWLKNCIEQDHQFK